MAEEVISSDLSVTGSASIEQNFQVNGNGFVHGGLSISGPLTVEGALQSDGPIQLNGDIQGNHKGAIRIANQHGWVVVGPRNSGWSHFSTDRTKFYFNKEIHVHSGRISSYDKDELQLCVNGSEKLRVKHNGNVGVGHASPQVKFHVKGNRIRLTKSNNDKHFVELRADGSRLDLEGSTDLYIGNNGNKVFYRNMSKVSSRELKEDISALSTEEALSIVEGLEPVRYRYKEQQNQPHQLGFIAEDVPEAVAQPDRKGIDEMSIVAALCGVVREQRGKMTDLEEKVETLANTIKTRMKDE